MAIAQKLPGVNGVRVLVTGGSGFIGSHLVEGLLAWGAEVAVLSRGPGKLAETPLRGYYTLLRSDINDTDDTVAAIKSFAPDIIYHLAAHPDAAESQSQASKALATNGIGTLNVLEGARAAGTGLFVYADSTKAYGAAAVPYNASTPVQPACSYAIGKVTGWEVCRLYQRIAGIKVVSIRPALTYGPRQAPNLISYVMGLVDRGERRIVLDGGSQTRDPLFVKDVVDAYLRVPAAAERVDGKVLNIGGGTEFTILQIAEAVGQAMGCTLTVAGDSSRMRDTEIMRMYCDNSEAEALLGWTPRTKLSEGLRQTARYAGEVVAVPVDAVVGK